MQANDNIGARILRILQERGIKPTPFEESQDISRGYLKRAADNGTGIGSEIVEKILLKFGDVDAYWLITGKEVDKNIEQKAENLTAATNSNEAAVLRKEIEKYKDQAEKYRKAADALARVNLMNAQTIAELTGGEMVE